MKKTIIPIRLPEAICQVDVPVGATARGVVMSVERVSSLLATEGRPAVREVINVLFECSVVDETQEPDLTKRKFVIFTSGKMVEDEKLTYVGSAPSAQTGNLLHVFEVGDPSNS